MLLQRGALINKHSFKGNHILGRSCLLEGGLKIKSFQWWNVSLSVVVCVIDFLPCLHFLASDCYKIENITCQSQKCHFWLNTKWLTILYNTLPFWIPWGEGEGEGVETNYLGGIGSQENSPDFTNLITGGWHLFVQKSNNTPSSFILQKPG